MKSIVNKEQIIILVILIVAFFLRFYRINDTFGFQGELGDNLLSVKNAIVNKEIPLLGPATSHPWLFFGPLFYWMLIPWLLLFSFDPITLAYFGAVFGVLGVYLNYIVIKELINTKTALLSSFLVATSAYFIIFSRSGRFMFMESVLFYILVHFLYRIYKEKYKYIFHAGLTFGIMMNFHLTPIVLIIPISIMVYRDRNKITNKMGKVFYFLLGFFIPTLPFLVYDFKNMFSMSTKLILWIPYRMLGFVGLIGTNNISFINTQETVISIFNFFISVTAFDNNILGILVFILIIIYVAMNVYKTDFIWTIIKYFLFFSFIAFIIHTNPPSHYFISITPIPVILLSMLFINYYNKQKYIVLVLLIFVFISNIKFLFSNKYYFRKSSGSASNAFVPYSVIKNAAQTVVNDSSGKSFSIKRVGDNDDFGATFAQNYQYLMWMAGNEPVKVGELVVRDVIPEIEYIIIEDRVDEIQKYEYRIRYDIGNITILKK